MGTRVLAPLMISLALALAACGGGATESATSADSPGTSATSSGPTTSSPSTTDSGQTEVAPFLDFTAETVRGEQFVGADHAGQDLVLWFWAPW